MSVLAFVDLETTGGNALRDGITEIGVIRVDPSGTRQWSRLVNPGMPIPGTIQILTGISDAMVADAPTFDTVAEELRQLLDGAIFIAHNARFDYGFLRNAFKQCGIDFAPPVLCTVKLSRQLFPQERRHNLDSLIARHDLRADGRHRALADAELIHQFWQRLEVLFSPEVLQAAMRQQLARPSLPPHLDHIAVDELPQAPGVYLIYGENELPLYVGKAKNIRSRVLSHFSQDHASSREMSLSQQARRVDWIRTGGEIGALLTEAALVKQLQPILNRQLRRNNELCTLRLAADDNAPEILFTSDLGFGVSDDLFGLFKSRKAATRALQELATEHGLCQIMLGIEKASSGRPCFGHQIRTCRGACIGAESPARHRLRVLQALAHLKLKVWPFDGPAILREDNEILVIDQWRYLGRARDAAELEAVLESGRPAFDQDTYKILIKAWPQLQALAR